MHQGFCAALRPAWHLDHSSFHYYCNAQWPSGVVVSHTAALAGVFVKGFLLGWTQVFHLENPSTDTCILFYDKVFFSTVLICISYF